MLMQYLMKATTTTSDFTGGSNGGYLSAFQVKQFLRLAMDAAVILKEARVETSPAPKFEVPRISLNSRVLRAGTEATRLADGDRVKVGTGLMSLSTVLFKGELPVSDETFEDQVEREALADTLTELIAQAVGRDAEEILLKSDTTRDPGGADSADGTVFDQMDGFLKRAQALFPAAQKIDATGISDADQLFAQMVKALPSRYRQGNIQDLRLYVPTTVRDTYQEQLSDRGTGLGDQALIRNMATELGFRGIPVKEVPLMSGTDTINGTAVDYSKFAFLTHPKNMVVGFQRRVRVERFRDPREGATSFLPSVRFDGDWADPNWGVLAENVSLA